MGPLDIFPDPIKRRLYDRLIDHIASGADSVFGRSTGNKIRAARTEARFVTELEHAIERAADRVATETQYPDILEELLQAKKLWQSDELLEAIERIIKSPASKLSNEKNYIAASLSNVMPEYNTDSRYSIVLGELLETVVEEIWHHPDLSPIYSLHMQRMRVRQGNDLLAEVRGLRDDNSKLIREIATNRAMGAERPKEITSKKPQSLSAHQKPSTAGLYKTDDEMNLQKACRELISSAASRDSFLVPLPRIQVPCIVHRYGNETTQFEDTTTVGAEFLADTTANLLVVLGEFGSGKSEFLRGLASEALNSGSLYPLLLDYADIATFLASGTVLSAIEQRLMGLSHKAASEFSQLVHQQPFSLLVLIDAFDEINFLLEAELASPNLKTLSSLFESRIKTVVAARRSLSATPDEFIHQLRRPGRIGQLGAQVYEIVELGPCRITEVNKALRELPSAQASTMRDYLTSGSHIQMDRVRRPLFLQMLIDLPSQLFAANENFSIYQLYDSYVEMTLERDVERTASLIPVQPKRMILQNIAKDMFDAQSRRSEARLSRDDVKRRVNEEISRNQDAAWVNSAPTDYHWIDDFNRSNHLIVERVGLVLKASPDVAFVHQSVFEFFLTQYFIYEFLTTGSFGLKDETHSVRAFDSLLPYFLRSRFGAGYEDELRLLVSADNCSNLDRLLGFFFLEDYRNVRDLLHSMPTSYLSFLREAEWKFDSFFMQKAVRFQLILIGKGIGRALAYVSDLRDREVDQDQDIEVHTFAAGTGPTEFLLRRIRNPELENALPITVYRLGQFGDTRAIEPLRQQLDKTQDPCLRALIDEALTRIIGRP